MRLTYPGLEADEFLLALGCCTDQHQHAFGGFFHSGLQIDPVRPHVHVSPRREVALLPDVVIRLPFCRQREITAGDMFGASLPKKRRVGGTTLPYRE